jgi:hypothetical protein
MLMRRIRPPKPAGIAGSYPARVAVRGLPSCSVRSPSEMRHLPRPLVLYNSRNIWQACGNWRARSADSTSSACTHVSLVLPRWMGLTQTRAPLPCRSRVLSRAAQKVGCQLGRNVPLSDEAPQHPPDGGAGRDGAIPEPPLELELPLR